jgi:hypothetical protein
MSSKLFNHLSKFESWCFWKGMNMSISLVKNLNNLNRHDLVNMVKKIIFSQSTFWGFSLLRLEEYIFFWCRRNNFRRNTIRSFLDGALSSFEPLEYRYKHQGIALRDLDRHELKVFLRNRETLTINQSDYCTTSMASTLLIF